jgi:hypothetical protein
VSTTEQIVKSASAPKTGLFATLRGQLHREGTGAPSSSTPRALALTLATMTSVLCVVFLAPSAALAARGHVFGKSFGEPCTGAGGTCEPGQLKEPAGVAVNEATGDIYVVDKGAGLVTEFDEAGDVVASFGNNGVGGAANGQLNGPSGKGEGMVIEGDSSIELVATTGGAFTVGEQISGPRIPAGTEITGIPVAGTLDISNPIEAGAPETVALAAHESLSGLETLAVDNACRLHKPELTEATSPTCHEFDPSDGDVYVQAGGKVDKFSSTGA